MEKEVGNDVKLLDKSTHPMSKRGEKTLEVAGLLGVVGSVPPPSPKVQKQQQ